MNDERNTVPGSVSARGERWLAQLPPSMGRRSKVHATEALAWQWLRRQQNTNADRPTIAGSVSAKGDRFLAQLPPSQGRRGKTHDTETAAWHWLQEEGAKATLGLPGGAASTDSKSVNTVGELIDIWLATHPTLKESTRIDYRIRIDKHVKSHSIAAVPIDQLRGMDIDACLAATPANWTRLHVAKILSPFCEWAENNRFTIGNPYRQSQAKAICRIMYRTVEARENVENTWTPEQLVSFIEHEPDPVYRDYWVFVAATGARRGEAVGARWSNMHAVDGWCWLADNITTAGSEVIHSETPKNWKRRKAYFGPVIGKMLLARHDEQDAYKADFSQWASDWVFDRRRGKGRGFQPGIHLAPATVTARFNRHAAQLGLPPLGGPHGLRRTFATIAENEGFNKSALRAALGHGPGDVSESYTKTTLPRVQELADRLANLILPSSATEDVI